MSSQAVTIREAEASDAEAIWRVEVETAEASFQGMLSDAAHRRFVAGVRRRNRWPRLLRSHPFFTLVAQDVGGQIVGYALAGPARLLPLGWGGELWLLYVLPSYQRRGVGRALVLAAGARLAEQGRRSMSVWTLATNAPSHRFYEALGAAPVGRRTMWVWPDRWPIVVYGWKPLSRLFEAAQLP